MGPRRVFAISETFYDILFSKGKPVSACPGGAMLNSSVSLGRAGLPVAYISEFSRDNVGNIILEFLEKNKVSTEYLYLYKGKSPLALAFLNEKNDAEYEFYEELPKERLDINIPDFGPDDIVLFGSMLAVNEKARKKLVKIINSAKKAGSLILYDPNFRASQFPVLDQIKPMIRENIALSDMIRASDQDMEMVFGCYSPTEAYKIVQSCGCNYLIYTSSSNGVHLISPQISKYYTIPSIETVSTVGAGDSFNAGIVFELNSKNISNLEHVTENEWDTIVKSGIDFASDVCKSAENYISNDFASGLKKA